ncbi:MAG: hypothetical protein IJA72_04760 [Clostridia bacterium]|nr:hypothetical protein [Clostridia bacterium]
MENKMDVKETIVKVFNGLNDVEVKGANNVMLMGQIMFDLGNLVQQLEQEDQESGNDGEDK